MRAYLAAAAGSFADAEARARRLLDDPEVGVAAALTLGSVLRQTARHDLARAIDDDALRRASSAEQRAHALISLAADAVGVTDRTTCARRLRAAGDIVPARAWRARVRLAWVQTEHALLTDDPARAVVCARDALARARRADARRHEAKSLLFLGVALGGGQAELRAARALARELGARPIAQVADAVLRARR